MGRLRRVVVPGLPHHITQRGVRRSPVFFDDRDRQIYLELLSEASELFGLAIRSYTLMTNHVHLIAVPEHEESLGKAMRDTHGPYAFYFNRRHSFCGHLWQARFHSSPLDDAHSWAAVRYVENNPVRSGMAEQAQDYPWSSAAAHCGLCEDLLLSAFDIDPHLIPDWEEWLAAGQPAAEIESIRKNTRTGRPVGSKPFIENLETKLGRRLRPAKRGRKKGTKWTVPFFSSLSVKGEH